MIGWTLAAIVAGGVLYSLLALFDEPRPLAAAGAAVVLVLCVLGFVATVRHRVWVDTSGIHLRTLSTTLLPWDSVAAVRLDRKVVRTPPVQDRSAREPGELQGDAVISRMVLVAELRNGRRVSLPISVAEDTMSERRAAELARLLDELRRTS